MFPELNRQRSRQEGDSAITTFGLDWDILRNANLRLEYQDFNPSDTNRNYIREFYDLQGNLYQIIRSQNRSKTFVGELNIKF
ncbi:MAG: hypothetical protein KatS3mg115_1460 [Candidatus Poribacteria bacterium]|nr:MAG: hypothetical protein KatS3mg115_1460 [Candidatus Poribacteria bacterium]